MYFDSTSFKKSLRVYIEPLGRIIQESLYEIPEKLVLATLWFAFHNPDSNEPGWLSIGLLLSLYALSVPIAILWLTLFNIKYGRLATS